MLLNQCISASDKKVLRNILQAEYRQAAYVGCCDFSLSLFYLLGLFSFDRKNGVKQSSKKLIVLCIKRVSKFAIAFA